jgi:ribosomal protein S18 acetylase RimI-like enzyme
MDLNKYLNYIYESESNIVIEELPDKDMKDLYPLMKRFAKSTNDSSYFSYRDEPIESRLKKVLEKGHIVLVARDNNEIVGLLIGVTKQGAVGQINMVYVDKPYRGIGLAEKMFKQVVEWLKQHKRPIVRVSVMGMNLRAQKFYKKMGFVVDSIKLRNKESKNIKSNW